MSINCTKKYPRLINNIDSVYEIDPKHNEYKAFLDFIDRNAEEYPDYPALNTPANSEYSAWDSISWSQYSSSDSTGEYTLCI